MEGWYLPCATAIVSGNVAVFRGAAGRRCGRAGACVCRCWRCICGAVVLEDVDMEDVDVCVARCAKNPSWSLGLISSPSVVPREPSGGVCAHSELQGEK